MAKHRLTDLFVKAARAPAGERIDIWDRDAPGLVLRVSPTGSKSYMYFYRFGRRFRKTKIGNAHDMPLAAARKLARDHRDGVYAGTDPVEQGTPSRPTTINGLADLFIERHCKRHKCSWVEDVRQLAVCVRPRIGKTLIRNVEKKDILAVIEAVAAGDVPGARGRRGGLRAADKVLAVVKTMFRWAVSEDLATHDPTAGIRRRYKSGPRERALSIGEIAEFSKRLPAIYRDEKMQIVAKLLLLTGQRRCEVLHAERSELHLDGAEPVWLLPGRRVKNKRPHTVPLSPAAKALWQRALELSGHPSLVFPSAKGRLADPQLVSKPLAKAFKTIVAAPLSFPAFTPHDLRRTAATHMARLGIERTIISKTLNHATADRVSITGFVYDKHDYLDEKRSALDKWAREIQRIIEPEQSATIINSV